ncbi:hypothetical protein Pint_35519 [Pistacia integerrima]|uniref:Uncharacterized protein n=1 Tax=Pistacia integerrima TaxID=434235 RepID=A0ACC0Y5F6_9ROSI|nr:hypothetical protein Pint_35519 [Pistacia integerrima]
MPHVIALPSCNMVSFAAQRPQRSKAKKMKQVRTKEKQSSRNAGFGIEKKEPLWRCVEGCGACCKLDKGPAFPTPEEIFDNPEDVKLYRSLIGSDGWCINYEKNTRKCSVYPVAAGTPSRKFMLNPYALKPWPPLSSSGFTLFAHALQRYNITTNSTANTTRLSYLALPDNALINLPLDAYSVRGLVPNAGAFYYQSLLTIPDNTTLPTLCNTTLIVETNGERVSFNDVSCYCTNLYIDGSCIVHGVERPLSSSMVHQDFAKARMETKSSPVSSGR